MGNERWSRRKFVSRAGKTAGAAFLGLSFADFLAACGTSTSGTSGPGKLEIFSWWTGPGEKDGLAERFKIYPKKNPTVTLPNPAGTGGPGCPAKTAREPPRPWTKH